MVSRDNVLRFPYRDVRRPPELGATRPDVVSFRVRVDLNDVRAPIWRRLELANDLNLAELHEILQTAMGWTDSHLHNFRTSDRHDVLPFLTDYDEEEGNEGVNERDVRLDQVLSEPGDTLFYDYDFGDGWHHTIKLEAITAYDGARRAVLTDGLRACPPENCGGPGGYEEILEAVARPEAVSDWQRERLEWLGDGYDSDSFSTAETNQLLTVTLGSLGGASAGEALLAVQGFTYSPALQDLVERSRREPKPLTSLVALADLVDLTEPDAAEKAELMKPWLNLMQVVDAGVPLTPAGWLPPTLVKRIASDLDHFEEWMGKGNREEFTVPVRLLRESAVAMGLLRKVNGSLVPTTRGLRAKAGPEQMWQHVVSSLPLGKKEHERNAGTIMLVAMAAGDAPYQGICRYGSPLLWSAGWSIANEPPSESAAVEFARPTWTAVQVLGATTGRISDEQILPVGRQFARAALRSSTD